MHQVLVFAILLLAGFQAYIAYRVFVGHLEWPANLLVSLVLYVFLQLIPVHLVAALELSGVIESVSFRSIFLFEVLISMGLLAYALRQRIIYRHLPNLSYSLSSFRGVPGYLHVAILIIGASWFIFLADQLTSYPKGWDALEYHLPMAVRWLQEGSLGIPTSGDWQYSLPANAELQMMLLLGSGFQNIATSFNLLAFVIAAISIYVISIHVTEKCYPSLISVILFASLPIVQFQAFSGYVDLFGTSFILAGVAIFLSRFSQSQDKARTRWYATSIGICGFSFGIAVGTKPTFYVYAALCVVGVSAIILAERKRHRMSINHLIILLVISTLFPSVFWFMRALCETGNPIYPLKLEVLGTTIFEGWRTADITPAGHETQFVRSTLEWLIYPWVEYKKSGYSYSTGTGLGAVWATFVPIGIAYGVYLVSRNIRKRDFFLHSILLVSLISGSIIWWHFLGRMLRFGIPILAISCILAAPLFKLLIKKKNRIFSYLLIISITTSCLISTYIPARSMFGRIRKGHWERAAFYGYPSLIDRLPKNTTVLNLRYRGTEISPLAGRGTDMFPLAGETLTNKVIPGLWVKNKSVYEFAKQNSVDYIADVHPFCHSDISEANSRLLFEGEVQGSFWRIWEMKKKR